MYVCRGAKHLWVVYEWIKSPRRTKDMIDILSMPNSGLKVVEHKGTW